MSEREREVPITVAQRVVMKFLTNENFGPMIFDVDYGTIRGINTIEDANKVLT
jgi:hypothetical protein